jgi:hypothetical protein
MTDAYFDELLRSHTWSGAVDHILGMILAEHLSSGSAHDILGATMKYFFERGATAVLDRDQSETGEATGNHATPTRH